DEIQETYDELKKESEELPDFDELKEDLKKQLETQKKAEKLEAKLEKLKEDATIEKKIEERCRSDHRSDFCWKNIGVDNREGSKTFYRPKCFKNVNEK